MIGHNGGPSMEVGAGFRKVAWRKARAALLPTLPLQVVRLRVKRAERLGLPYKTYATNRAVSGRDIVGFLFSSNALDLRGRPQIPSAEATRLRSLEGEALRIGAIHRPLSPEAILPEDALDAADVAPLWTAPWGAVRAELRAMLQANGLPFDGTVVVSATAAERAWSDCAGLAGALDAGQMFSHRSQAAL